MLTNNSDLVNKTIYMTYKKNVPDIVFTRWKVLNKEYKFDLSFDNDCIRFLEQNFNDYIANLFSKIPQGMYKADLWRLCKLYIYGGVYADIDLVPYLDIDKLDKDVTFYSCLALDNNSIFQAFMINYKPKSPLILQFLISFLLNSPYNYSNGPTYDMYNCISHNLNNIKIGSDKKYNFEEVKILVNIGTSETNKKNIDLYFFPEDINYNIKLIENPNNDIFNFIIENNILIIEKIDENTGWEYNHSINICIESNETIFLFKENIGPNNNWVTSYVTLDNVKILDSRDMDYHNRVW
jgi:hypothetical protein